MQKTPTISTWLFRAPFKFALLSFIVTTLLVLGYSLLLGLFLSPTSPMPQTPLYLLITLGFIGCIYLTVRKLPNIKMDKPSFIAIHNAQIILLFLLFSVSSYLLISHQQKLFFHLMMIDTTHYGSVIFIILLLSLFILFLFGTSIINLYIKIRRIQQFNVPTWKIICSFPFGFGMLWAPGYLLDTKAVKKPSQPIKSTMYSKIINWTLSNQINTISMFVFITILSGFFAGIIPVLMTFTLAMIFGLWSMKTGSKNFEKQMHNKYSTCAIAINILMIIIISIVYAHTPKQNIEISISETQIVTDQGQ